MFETYQTADVCTDITEKQNDCLGLDVSVTTSSNNTGMVSLNYSSKLLNSTSFNILLCYFSLFTLIMLT